MNDDSAPPSRGNDADRWRCCWTDGRERCHFPGSISHDTRGSSRWFCRFHYFCDDGIAGQRIIEQSRGYVQGEPAGVDFEEPQPRAPMPSMPVQVARLPYLDAEVLEQAEPGANG